MTGFAMAGKDVQQQQGQRQYSKDVSEALSDMGAISQIGLAEEDADEKQGACLQTRVVPLPYRDKRVR